MSIPTPQAILAKAQSILEQIAPFAAQIAPELTAEEQSTFRRQLEKLSSQAANVTTEKELLELTSDIIRAFEAIPLLRENFVGADESQERALSLDEFDEDDTFIDDSPLKLITNTIKSQIKSLIEEMPRITPTAAPKAEQEVPSRR